MLLFYLHQELRLVCRIFKEGNQHGEHLTLFEIITDTTAQQHTEASEMINLKLRLAASSNIANCATCAAATKVMTLNLGEFCGKKCIL